jgi:ribosomal protein L35
MAQKTNKSYTKRLKVTKTGKVLGRKPGFNHFNSKQKRSKQYEGKTPRIFAISKKAKARFMPHK